MIIFTEFFFTNQSGFFLQHAVWRREMDHSLPHHISREEGIYAKPQSHREQLPSPLYLYTMSPILSKLLQLIIINIKLYSVSSFNRCTFNDWVGANIDNRCDWLTYWKPAILHTTISTIPSNLQQTRGSPRSVTLVVWPSYETRALGF